MEQVLIGFGSNLGDSVRICLGAIKILHDHPKIHLLKVSSLYRTEPVGMVEQDWFINGVIQCETSMEPEILLEITGRIEEDFGRVRQIRWGPRSLDLDILSFGEREITLPRLTVPHPRLHERLFVLTPLMEIAPRWVHPVMKISAHDLLARLSLQGNGPKVERLEAP